MPHEVYKGMTNMYDTSFWVSGQVSMIVNNGAVTDTPETAFSYVNSNSPWTGVQYTHIYQMMHCFNSPIALGKALIPIVILTAKFQSQDKTNPWSWHHS